MRNLIEDTPTHEKYFTYHHSAGDTMTIMNADDLDDNVFMISAFYYIVADMDERFPRVKKFLA